ncbi:hypothetical protein GOP47_0010081 [Adiantum capillus-veneris]|uniref:Methyltransferase domain-containing protein n=1 Tax=Adiantum capillus-veneris TaxID=13818 RepID=A0A9D4UUS1_ADICA|nr:hypothetical protein GOP47_0010081 [Adiantum capillus-veneris]
MATSFGERSSVYAVGRPTYPRELFELLASVCKGHRRVWDVGTGNGQAAVGLADYFQEVIATDVSEQQLQRAERRPNISYRITSAGPLSEEEVALVVGEDRSLDLVTSAQAVHWLHLPSFYAHVRRLLRDPGGIVAVWCYTTPEVSADVDAVLAGVYDKSLPFWDAELEYVRQEYRTLPFPFTPVSQLPHRLNATKPSSLDDYLAFLHSWSTLHRARRAGVDLLPPDVIDALRSAWGPPSLIRTVTFPLHLRIGSL